MPPPRLIRPPTAPPPRLPAVTSTPTITPPGTSVTTTTPVTTAPNITVLSAPPSLMQRPKIAPVEEETQRSATIEAKPQIRNLSADVMRFMPTTLRVKREDRHKKGSSKSGATCKFFSYLSFRIEFERLISKNYCNSLICIRILLSHLLLSNF